MGVLGLSTFVHQHSDQFLLRQRVSSQLLLIDGDNLMYQLTGRTRRLHVALGGEYLRLEHSIRFFFDQLMKCDITSIVLFDGGTDPSGRKTKTQRRRLADKADTARHISLSNQHRFNLLPHLAKIVFIETLASMNVQYAVCDCEADEHLAALATRLNCAVLSDDSDFFAFAVRCVLLSSLASEASYDEENNVWFMDAVVFCNDKFISHHGLSRPVLPLLYCLQGNDYLSPSLLASFYHHHVTRLPSGHRGGSQSQRRVRGLLMWLRGFSCPYTALNQVLQHVPVKQRATVRRNVLQCLHNYTRLPDQLVSCLKLDFPLGGASVAPSHIPSSSDVCSSSDTDSVPNAVTTDEMVETSTSTADGVCARSKLNKLTDDISRLHLTVCNTESEDVTCVKLKTDDREDVIGDQSSVYDLPDSSAADDQGQSKVPSDRDDQNDTCSDDCVTWSSPVEPLNERLPCHLLATIRTGAVTSGVINLINGQPVVFDPQVEDFTMASPAMSVLPLLSAQHAILQYLLGRHLPAGSALLRDEPKSKKHQRHCSIVRVQLPSLSPTSATRIEQAAAEVIGKQLPNPPRTSLLAVLSVLGVNLNTDTSADEDDRVGVILLWTGALTFWYDICTSMTSVSVISQLTALILSASVLDSGWFVADCHSPASSKCRRLMSRWRAGVWRMCGAWLNRQCSTGSGGGTKRALISTLHKLSAYQLILSQVRNIAALLRMPRDSQLPEMARLFSGVLAATAADSGASHSCCCRHGGVRASWLPPCRPLAATLLTVRRRVLSMVGVSDILDQCDKCPSCDVTSDRVGSPDDVGECEQYSEDEHVCSDSEEDECGGDDGYVCHRSIVSAETFTHLSRL